MADAGLSRYDIGRSFGQCGGRLLDDHAADSAGAALSTMVVRGVRLAGRRHDLVVGAAAKGVVGRVVVKEKPTDRCPWAYGCRCRITSIPPTSTRYPGMSSTTGTSCASASCSEAG